MNSKPKIDVSLSVQITLNESEARALDAIFGYNADGFIKGFYKQLGRHYLEPHTHAVPALFDSVNKQIRPALYKVDEARKKIKTR